MRFCFLFASKSKGVDLAVSSLKFRYYLMIFIGSYHDSNSEEV